MVVKYTGLTEKTAERFLMNAGAVYKNLKYDAQTGAWNGSLLGATSGGNEFSLTLTTRQIQIDGVRGMVKGGTQIDEEIPQLTVNLKELTAENLALAIAGSKITSDQFYDKITSKGVIDISDYLENIAYVGRLSGSERPVVIIIKNAISLEGLNMKTADGTEVVIPMVFRGTYDQATLDAQEAPYEIYWPKESEDVEDNN